MQRNDSSRFLLFIEPTLEQRSGAVIEDEYTMILRMAMSEAKLGTSNYSSPKDEEPWFKVNSRYGGTHRNCDDTISTNYDLLLPNEMITNSLAVYYLMWYRMAIPTLDWEKIKELQRYYGRIKDDENLKKGIF